MDNETRESTSGESTVPNSSELDSPTSATCGLVMPISDTPGYNPGHWIEVRSILHEALDPAFHVRMVSESEDVTFIHKTIVQNLYENDLVVCDLSGKNPNVMFELGIRLTFDRATVIVIDDETAISFDTGVIEHIIYPKSLRFREIVEFKEKLARKSAETLRASRFTEGYSPFLAHYGTFKLSVLPSQTVSPDQLVIEKLDEMSRSFSTLRREVKSLKSRTSDLPNLNRVLASKVVWMDGASSEDAHTAQEIIRSLHPGLRTNVTFRPDGQPGVRVQRPGDLDAVGWDTLLDIASQIASQYPQVTQD
jgi:hypothetical protein